MEHTRVELAGVPETLLRNLHQRATELVPPRDRGIVYGGAFPLLNRISSVRRLGVTGLPMLRLRFADRR
jgi:hypothetical protein